MPGSGAHGGDTVDGRPVVGPSGHLDDPIGDTGRPGPDPDAEVPVTVAVDIDQPGELPAPSGR